ncbi:MAG: methyltransferase domain-containing protein [Candidatus Binatia bacterium]
MFRWRPELEPLLAPAAIETGQVIVDYGCGPGMLASELAGRVGPSGTIHAVDLNEEFVRRTRERAAAEGFGDRVSVHRVADDRLPLADGSVDRVICKNVLEYVTDVARILREFRRVLRPGGLLHAIDSDWGMLVVEPIGAERLAELFAAAAFAYRTPLIGRKLFGLFRETELRDVNVRVLTGADTRGHLAPIVFNMASYARASGRLDTTKIDRLVADVRRSITERTYLLVLPQFLVTGAV